MKTVLSALWRAICHFSLAFSGIILFFWRFMLDNSLIGLKPESISVFATFALIFGISSFVFSIPKLTDILKTAIHFVINTIGFLSTFVAVDGVTQARAFIAGALFVVIYLVVFLLSLVFKKLANGKAKEENV
ncbi:MAG: hypothetical protein IKL05_01860 [Clostridia bacterium]|nr:hypothetical protein [Clostridia bacterium]